MIHESSEFHNAQGDKIFQQSWLPDGPAKADVFIIHGLGEHSGRYSEIAHFLVERGYRAHALDHPGHGKSDGLRAYIDDFSIFTETASDFIKRIQSQNDELPSYIIGHSMGGVITSNLLIDHPSLVAGAILSGPALATDEAVGPVQTFILKLIAKFFPKLPVFQLDANLICRNPAVVEEYLNDPLVYSGKIRARLLIEIVGAGERALQRAAEITLPMLMLHGEEDGLASVKGSQAMFAGISSEDKDIIIYPELFHEIFNEDSKRDIYDTVTNWLDNHCQTNN